MGKRLLAFKELKDHGVNYKRRRLGDLERLGQFPRRVPIGPRHVAWVEQEIDDWVEARINARSGERPKKMPRRNAGANPVSKSPV